MVCFVVDGRERVRGRVACDGFRLEGFDSVVGDLVFGDYVVDGLVVWEYKTVSDFVSSLFDESLFNEVFNQSEKYPFSFLIVEGDFSSFFYKQYFNRGKHYKKNGENVKEYVNRNLRMVDGAIRRCRTVCNVIIKKTEAECLNEIMEQSLKCLNFKGYGGVVRPSHDYQLNPCKTMLMEVKGIGDKISDNIIEEYGLTCIDDLSRISFDGLCSVKNVTPSMAKDFWYRMYNEKL